MGPFKQRIGEAVKKSTGVLGVVVILGVAYLGTTWYVGKRTQDVVHTAFAQANERVQGMLGKEADRSGVKMTIIEYHRGFFSSDVIYGLQAKDAQGAPLEIRLHDHIQHGPFPLGAIKAGDFRPLLAYSDTALVPTPATQAWVDSQNGASPLTAHTVIKFSRDGETVWDFKPASFKGKEGLSFAFSGGTMSMDFSNDFKDNSAQAKFDAFSAVDAQSGGKMQLTGIKASGTTRTDADSSVTSKSQALIDSIVIQGEPAASTNEDAFTLKKAVIGLSSKQVGGMLDGALNYDFGNVLIGKTDMGSVVLGARLSQLDVKALVALGNEYDAIMAKQQDKQAEPVLSAQDQQVLQTKAMALLASSPKFEFDPVVWKNAKGETRAALHIDFTAPAHPDAAPTGSLVPEYLQKIALSLSVSRPMMVEMFGQLQQDQSQREQLEQAGGLLYDQYVSRLTQAGLIKVDKDNAKTNIVYENNSFDVNGQQVSVQDFMMRFMVLLM